MGSKWIASAVRFTAPQFNGRFCPLKQGGIDTRYLVLAIVLAAGVSLIGVAGAAAAPANGQPIAQAADHVSNTIDVRGGCGRGWHRGPHGHCHRKGW